MSACRLAAPLLFTFAAVGAAGCAGSKGDSAPQLECTAALSANVATVVTLDWSTDDGGTSTVEFGETEAYGMQAPATSAADVHLALVGMPEDVDVYWRGRTVSAGGETSECTGVTHTGEAPSDIPRAEALTNEAGQDPAGFVIGAYFAGAGSSTGRTQLAAYRRDGALVWYYDGDESSTGLDLHYALDGNGILFNSFGGHMGGEEGTIQRVSLEGELLETLDAPYAHHTFCELPDGTITFQQIDVREFTDPESGQTDDWVGDALAEIPPGGAATTVFSTWDVLEAGPNSRTDDLSIYGGVDWTHGNFVSYDAATDQYLLSLGHADDLLQVRRSDYGVETVYGLDGIAADPPFDYQHDPSWLDNGNLLMFMSDDDGSGAIEYALVDGAPVEVWRAGFTRKAIALGEAQRLSNGNTFINFGAGNDLVEVTPDGETVWDLAGEHGAIFAQFQLVTDLYTGAR